MSTFHAKTWAKASEIFVEQGCIPEIWDDFSEEEVDYWVNVCDEAMLSFVEQGYAELNLYNSHHTIIVKKNDA